MPLAAAIGAVLAGDAAARTDLPPADTAAMDGWAVRGAGPWRVVGRLLAGDQGGPLADGEAVEIATGAALPPRALAVLRREHGLCDGTTLAADPAVGVPAPGTDLRRAGTECRAGQVVLGAGARLNPAALGLLAAAGFDAVPVRRARVLVLVLGAELLAEGPARDGRVRDALGPLLAGWLPGLGVELLGSHRLGDGHAELRAALVGAAERADVVVTTGSTARGPVDRLHDVLAELGAPLPVDGVRVRPGHPMLLARLAPGTALVGLPGNPLAAVSGLLTLLDPVLRSGHGLPPAAPRRVALAQEVPAGEATRLVPVRGGVPVTYAGPAMLRGLAGADGVAVVPPGGAVAGQQVEVLTLPGVEAAW